MRNTNLVVLGLAATLLVAGCAREHLRSDFGKSTEINRTAQVVDPAASKRDYPMPTADGKKVEASIDRYQKEKPESSRGKLVSDVGN